MSVARILLRLIITLGCAFLMAYLGTLFLAFRIAGKPQQFCSQAKLLLDAQLVALEMEDKEFGHGVGTTTETLESAEMKRRALERVRALYPNIHDSDVEIRAVQTRGGAIMNLIATGPEPKYTKIFLDALLDEFIAFRQDIREKAQERVIQKERSEATALQKEMKETEAALEKARASSGSVSANLDQVRLMARLTTLRNDRDERRLAIGTMAENNAGRALLQTRLSAIELEIQDLEAQLQRHEAAAAELRVLTEKFDAAKQAYDKKSEQASEHQTSIDKGFHFVTIQERATPAYEVVEKWTLPVVLMAIGGGVIGLLLSLFLVRAPKPLRMPRGLSQS